MNKEFAIYAGDIICLDKIGCTYIALHQRVQTYVLQSTSLASDSLTPHGYGEYGKLPFDASSQDWMRWLDERVGRSGWTLWRKIGPVEWISIPRSDWRHALVERGIVSC